jgi:hypothetical protein
MTSSSSSSGAPAAALATAAVVAVGAAAAATAVARRRAARSATAAEPSQGCQASPAAAARRWNAQNPPSVFQLAVFFADGDAGAPIAPAAFVLHPRRGALADLVSAVGSAANGGGGGGDGAPSSPPQHRLFLSVSGTGAGPFVELAPQASAAGSSADPDAPALGALEEVTDSAKRVAVVYAAAAAAPCAAGLGPVPPALAARVASHPGLADFPEAPGSLPVLGHALLAARGPYIHPMYNLAHNVFSSGARKGGKGGKGGGGDGDDDVESASGDTIRVRLPAMGAPRGVVVSAADGDDPRAWRTLLLTRDPRVVAELMAREDLWPKKFDRPPQELLRDFAGPGLFTSSSDEPDWVTAHGVLPKLFNALRVTAMFPAVMTKTRAFVARWAAMVPAAGPPSSSPADPAAAGPAAIVDHASDWLTSMTIDAVVLAAVGLDMKNVERLAEGRPLHPFVTAFRYGLGYAVGNVSVAQEFGRLAALNPMFDGKEALHRRYLEAKATCAEIVAGLVEQTRAGELRGAGGQPNVIAAMLSDRSTADGSLVPVSSFYGHMINIM